MNIGQATTQSELQISCISATLLMEIPKGKPKKHLIAFLVVSTVLCKKDANVIHRNLFFVLANLQRKINQLSKEISSGSSRKTSEVCSIFAVTKFEIANFRYKETKVQSIEVQRSEKEMK